MLHQFLEIAGRDGAVLVAAAVVDEERPVDHDRAAREAHAAIEAFDLVVRLRLHQPVGRAVQDDARVLEVQQHRAEAVVLVRADRVVDRQPAVRRLDRRRVDAQLGRLPRVLVRDQQLALAKAHQVVGEGDPRAGLLDAVLRARPTPAAGAS